MSGPDYETFYREMPWKQLMDEYWFFVDFPRQQVRTPDIWRRVSDEIQRRHDTGTAGVQP